MTPDTQCMECRNRTSAERRPRCEVYGVIPIEFLSNDEPCPSREPTEESDADEPTDDEG